MTAINESAQSARESARESTGQFGAQEHTDPEATLATTPTLVSAIAGYLASYDDAERTYSEESETEDADEAYEVWEDFRTDNSGKTYEMLTEAKAEIERLQAELSNAQSKHAIPEELRTVIEEDFADSADEPLLYVPEDGQSSEGYFDVIAVVDGESTRKYTQTPEGDIDWARA